MIAGLLGCGGTPGPAPASPGAGAGAERRVPETPTPAPASSGAEAAALGRTPSRSELAALEPLMRAAESVRGLRFVREVPVLVQTRSEITSFVAGAMEPAELERARVFYVALGLLPADLDVGALLLRVMGEQIVGYYDPDSGRMVVRDDVMVDLGARGMHGAEAAVTLVHEYVHALQDQVLGLGLHDDDERTIDAENAFAALIEGDATLAMVGLLALGAGGDLERLTSDPHLLASLVSPEAIASSGAELGSAPAIVRAPLVSRYLDGMLFCAYLHGALGGWSAVDAAHGRLPTTTEEVLHPERFGTRAPDVVALPPLAGLEADGFVVHDEDTLGELEIGIYLAQDTDQDREVAASDGWSGDRLRVYRRGDETAVAWITTWDTEAEAIEASRAFARVRDAIPASRRATHLVQRTGRAVIVLRDVPAARHAEVGAALESAAAIATARPR